MGITATVSAIVVVMVLVTLVVKEPNHDQSGCSSSSFEGCRVGVSRVQSATFLAKKCLVVHGLFRRNPAAGLVFLELNGDNGGGLGFRVLNLDYRWEFPKIRGTLFWGPYNKDRTI